MDKDGRTAKVQAGYQIAGLAVALGIAIIGGIITGRVISLVKISNEIKRCRRLARCKIIWY